MSPRLGVVVGLLAAVAARCAFDPTPGTVLSGLGLLVAFTLTLRARRMFVPEALLSTLSDAAYLWTGTPPAGMRTQQYAHRGAFWLTIALVMCTGLVGVMFRGPLSHDLRAKT